MQEKNVEKKQKEKQELKQKSLSGMKAQHETDKLMEKAVNEANENDDQVDDDAEYYKEEVGEKPDKNLFDEQIRGTKRAFKIPAQYNKDNKRIKLSSKSEGRSEKSKNKTEDKFKSASKFKSKGTKKVGGRGNHPKYGWRNQEGNDDKSFKNKKANVKHIKKNKK